MKIMILSPTLTHAGAERVIANLANKFAELGHDIEIYLYLDLPVWYEIDKRIKITVEEKLLKKTNLVNRMRFRRKYIRNNQADVVLSFLAPFNMVNIVTVFGLKTPLIVADRNDPRCIPVNPVIRAFRNFLYRFSDGAVFQSNNNKAYFSKTVQKKSAVIFNPIDLKEYKGCAFNSPKKLEIVSVGRLIKQKNPMMFLNAFARICNDFPNHSLVFYGDGDMKDEISEAAEKLGISNRISLPGAVKNVFEEIKTASLYVMTSEYEGMPNALLEAMCLGLPVISTKVSGAVDVIENGENGLLVECGNVGQLADAMKNLLSDSSKNDAFRQKAVLLADKLDNDSIANQWLEFIKEICSK